MNYKLLNIRYSAQDASSIFNFNFEAPLMRSFYANNKSDKAIELFMEEVLKS